MKKQLNICFLAPRSSIHTIRWVNALAAQGINVSLITMHPQGESLHPKVKLYELPYKAPHGYFLNHFALSEILKREKADVLHAHFASGYGTLARIVNFHPLLLSVWGSDVFEFPDKNKFFKNLLVKNLRAADYIASTSDVLVKRVSELTHLEKAPFKTPFGIDINKFFPAPHGSLDSSSKFRIGTVKTLHPRYGIDTLIRAYKIARERGLEDSELCIIGDGPQKAELFKLVQELKLENEVIFPGAISHFEVTNWLRTFNMFCALSNNESFGVAILEASACGLPVVVSNVGGLPEVVKEGETGFIVEKGNSQAAAYRILEIYKSQELAKKLGDGGVKFVSSTYEWSKSVCKMIEIYNDITP